jgi:hypothetical protein
MWQLKNGAQVVVESKVEFVYSTQELAWFCVRDTDTTWLLDQQRQFVPVEVPDSVAPTDGGPSVIE